MRVCSSCGKKTKRGKWTYNNLFLCETCITIEGMFHTDSYEIQDGEVVKIEPLANMSRNEQRGELIDLAYSLFNNKLSPSIFSLIEKYEKEGYTFLGMIRALEWFYIIKKNDRSKAKGSIGIVPYVYKEANDYYDYYSNRTRERYLKILQSQLKEDQDIVLESKGLKERRQKQIGIEDIL